MQNTGTEKHFILILLILVALLTLAIFYPFLTVIILGGCFAIIINPVYLWIKKHITRNISWIASTLTIILFLIILCIPLFFLAKTVILQVQDTYINLVRGTNTSEIIEKLNTSINRLIPNGFSFDLHEKIVELAGYLSISLPKLFSYTFNTIIIFILMILTIFYILNNGTKWKETFSELLPISKANTDEIFGKLKDAVNRIFRGFFFVGIVQGFFAWLGFTIFGIPNAILWAVLAAFASIIPTFGTSIITVPAMIYLVLTGSYLNALLLLIWSILIVSTVDNIISPYVISKDTNISPMFILFSVLGGIYLFGPVGIIIGPLVISLLFCLVPIYKRAAQIE